MWPFRTRSPRNITGKRRAGVQALAHGDYATAVRWLGEVVAERPDDVSALMNLGAAYHGAEQHSRAIKCFEYVTVLRPNYAEAWLNLAAAHSSLGHLAKAEEALNKVVQITPHFPNVHYNVAVVKLRQRLPLEALAELELQMAANPRHATARELLTELRAAMIR